MKRLIVVVVLGMVAVLIGAWIAGGVSIGTPEDAEDNTRILDIKIGTPKKDRNTGKLTNQLAQKDVFDQGEPIALRVKVETSQENVMLPVRLLDSDNKLSELNPGTVTFPPGDRQYCCWELDEVGSFKLQIFRPEGGITEIPFKIRRKFGG